MNEILLQLEPKQWLDLNAKLQAKKNTLRKALKEKGVLKKGATNTYDKYNYFSEAQYKELFTELLSENGLELKFNELEYTTFTLAGKQPNGRMPKLEFYLFDTETGFFETTIITGEGIDKGDKAGYKAYTGALKYYLADTFMVATGDDVEIENAEAENIQIEKVNEILNDQMTTEPPKEKTKATAKQIEMIKDLVEDIPAMLEYYKIDKIEDLDIKTASGIISKKKGAKQWAIER